MVAGTRRVVWIESAQQALDEVIAYIAHESPDAAVRVLSDALSTAASLSALADRGRVVREIGDSTVRELLVHDYRLLYRVRQDAVVIRAFLHGARGLFQMASRASAGTVSRVLKKSLDASTPHTRRPRYPGKNPRAFHEKYKELNPERYASEVQKILASGKTPAGTHLPIMVDEVLRCLQPSPGDIAVDCTLGGGGHAQAILGRIQPGGWLIGLDVDPLELPRTEARLRAAGFGAETFVVRQGNFAGLPQVLAAEGIDAANVILADLGVSSMQIDNPDRGFSYKEPGPLDMRMNPSRGEPAWQLLARLTEDKLASLLTENADEPHAALIARLLKEKPLATTHAVERSVRTGLTAAFPKLAKADVKMSVRRTFQALRIQVNDEFSALDALLRSLPQCLAPGGRVAIVTFHSGEDRRVKKAFQVGYRAGTYSDIAHGVIRSTKEETFSNRRASAAKLRWAVRAS